MGILVWKSANLEIELTYLSLKRGVLAEIPPKRIEVRD
jgi:hypothetical protein